eukprot:TRINITY_DN61075_c0_g1_i1.p1 TRINITY_DN61075_c0_g1~~TRINITY_DN61075_c0_g1_i1.p1  ORF type:complete len:465 (-),score=58.58 TRINITY_DN61075_c0_g1_i1:51-1445(-)
MSLRLVPRAFEVAKTQRRVSSKVVRTSAPGPTLWFPKRGFEPRSFGLDWFPNAEALFESIPAVGPRPVCVAAPYESETHELEDRSGGIRQARKYAMFPSHADYWDFIDECEREERPQSLQEIFLSEQPRCLYFDLDGHPAYKRAHKDLMRWLQLFVRWFFSGDQLGWAQNDPEPVVLTSAEPSKYSCHVMFPQVQFSSHAHQCEYISALLGALPALEVDLEGRMTVQVLDRLVDRVPYSKFQCFRGPYACKLKTGELCYDTRLEPEMFFHGDELTCFAGHVDSGYSLPLPKLSELLEWNKELKDFCSRQQERLRDDSSSSRFFSPASSQNQANLYRVCFQKRHLTSQLNLAGRTEIERFEACLEHLHPDRASDRYSWWTISGVTSSLLQDYGSDDAARARIWKAHFGWSSGYTWFDKDENIDMVERANGKRTSGIRLLSNLVKHDNPGLEVRDEHFRIHYGRAS